MIKSQKKTTTQRSENKIRTKNCKTNTVVIVIITVVIVTEQRKKIKREKQRRERESERKTTGVKRNHPLDQLTKESSKAKDGAVESARVGKARVFGFRVDNDIMFASCCCCCVKPRLLNPLGKHGP